MQKFGLYLILCVLFFREYACHVPKFNQTIEEFCIEDTGVTKEMVEKIVESPEKEMTQDENCFIHCVYTELGFLDEEGNIVLERFTELKEEVADIDLKCLEEAPQILDCTDIKYLKDCNV